MTIAITEAQRQAVLDDVSASWAYIYDGSKTIGAVIFTSLVQCGVLSATSIKLEPYKLDAFRVNGEREMLPVRLGFCVAYSSNARRKEEVIAAAIRVLDRMTYPAWEPKQAHDLRPVNLPFFAAVKIDRNAKLLVREQFLRSLKRKRGINWSPDPQPTVAEDKPARDSFNQHGLVGYAAVFIIVLCIFLSLTMTGRVVLSTIFGRF